MRRAIVEFKEALDRVRSRETSVEDVRLPSGTLVRLVHDPESEACYRIEPLAPEKEGRVGRSGEAEIAVRSLVFDDPHRRPAGYPEDLPFLPDRSVSLMEIGPDDVRLLSWSRIPDPTPVLSALKEQLLAAGWTLVRDTTVPAGVLKTVGMAFQRDGLERFFIMTRMDDQSHLMMREFRVAPGEPPTPSASDEAS